MIFEPYRTSQLILCVFFSSFTLISSQLKIVDKFKICRVYIWL